MLRLGPAAIAIASVLALAACSGGDAGNPSTTEGGRTTTTAGGGGSVASGGAGQGGATTSTTHAGGATTTTTSTSTTTTSTHAGGAAGAGGATTTTTSIPTEDPFDPPPTPAALPPAAVTALQADVDAALAGASGAVSALVVGLDSGQILYEKAPDTLRTPASNTKLFTTAAALLLEGEGARPVVGLYGPKPQGGVVAGDVTLVLEEDPSNDPWFAETAHQPLDAIARALAASGVKSISGDVVVKGEALYDGDPLGTIDFALERTELSGALKTALVGAGLAIGGAPKTATGFTPPAGAELLVDAASASMDVWAHATNVPSHNELADLLMHRLGRLGGGQPTYADGFVTVQSMLDGAGVAHAGMVLLDGSGLSHGNLVSTRQIVDLFGAMAARPEWPAYVHSLAIAGVRGTISSRMTGADTKGRFWGKTGTLSDVVALSGVLFHAHDGQRYVASFIVNGVADTAAARAAVDGAVAAIAKDRRGSSGLLPAPRLRRVGDDANGETVGVVFDEVAGATGYLVWRSADGRVWRREDARLVTKGAHRTLAMNGALFVRVTAVNDAGEGPPSSVLATRLAEGGATPVLFVDGDDRYAADPIAEDPLAWGDHAVVAHAAAIDGPFEGAWHGDVEAGAIDLAGRPLVVWALGRESTAGETFSVAEQEVVRAFVDGGGRLFVSGSEIGWDLVAKGTADDAAFAHEVLGVDYVADEAKTTLLAPGDVDLGFTLARFSKLGQFSTPSPDALSPAAGGLVCLRYAAGVDAAACVRTDTKAGGRVTAMGVPLEALDDAALGAKLVQMK